jgi:hypothetical protein
MGLRASRRERVTIGLTMPRTGANALDIGRIRVEQFRGFRVG